MELQELDAYIERAQKLQTLLRETPEIIKYMELAKDAKSLAMPIVTDTLVLVGQAAKILHVSPTYIYQYIKEGRLVAYYTPGSSYQKFWLSDVKKLAKREREKL